MEREHLRPDHRIVLTYFWLVSRTALVDTFSTFLPTVSTSRQMSILEIYPVSSKTYNLCAAYRASQIHLSQGSLSVRVQCLAWSPAYTLVKYLRPSLQYSFLIWWWCGQTSPARHGRTDLDESSSVRYSDFFTVPAGRHYVRESGRCGAAGGWSGGWPGQSCDDDPSDKM